MTGEIDGLRHVVVVEDGSPKCEPEAQQVSYYPAGGHRFEQPSVGVVRGQEEQRGYRGQENDWA